MCFLDREGLRFLQAKLTFFFSCKSAKHGLMSPPELLRLEFRLNLKFSATVMVLTNVISSAHRFLEAQPLESFRNSKVWT
jgi:hypothetical protein